MFIETTAENVKVFLVHGVDDLPVHKSVIGQTQFE